MRPKMRPLYWALVALLLAAGSVARAGASTGPAESILTNFYGLQGLLTARADAAGPDGPLLSANGVFYGASLTGGQRGYGAIFELKPPSRPGAPWTHTVIYSFSNAGDGNAPSGHLLYWHGAIFGTTSSAAVPAAGTVYRLKFGPAGWVHETLYTFPEYQFGGTPLDGVIAVGDSLYGTNSGSFPASYYGSVFRLSPPPGGIGAWRESALHVFTGGSDGGGPYAGLVSIGGAFYGTTFLGGSSNEGVLFQLALDRGHWQLTTLHPFFGSGDGAQPAQIIALNGALYGVAINGGAGSGTVFYDTPGPMGWTFATMHVFAGGADGATPSGSLVGVGGALYGTTVSGGQGSGSGFGTVFSVTALSNTIVHSFGGGPADGTSPRGLSVYAGGLIGVTAAGGASNNGTVFSIQP